MAFEKDPDEIGALWIKEGKGGTYFSGKIGDQAVVVFKNTKKAEGSSQPDYRVLKAKPRKELRQDDELGGW